MSKEVALQASFKAINDSAGPNGLVPTLLVYGALPRVVDSDPPSLTVSQRATVYRKAMAEIRKLQAKRQINDALNTRNGPNTLRIHDLPLNSDVLVFRENQGWQGPYKLVSTDGESCTVALSHGNTAFRSTHVKPYLVVNDDDNDDEITSETEEPAEQAVEEEPRRNPTRTRLPPRKYWEVDTQAFLQTEEAQFASSRHSELLGLIEKGVFKVMEPSDVPEGIRTFNSRFVDDIKLKNDVPFMKSRLVVQAYNDDEKKLVLTQSPTIQRISQRILLCVAAMGSATKKSTKLYLRDISQAYVQSTTELNREFFIKPPRELAEHLKLNKGAVLKVLKPLYGVPEAGNHWFSTYHSHHINELSMKQSTYDPCLLYNIKPFGVVGLQTDDTLFVADVDFAKLEEQKLGRAQFLAKERDILTTTSPLKFNGGLIKLEPDGVTLTQERQCKNLKPVRKEPTSTTSSRGATRADLSTREQYIAQRARGAYIATVCQPEAAYALAVAAQSTETTPEDIKALNKRIQWQIENPSRGLRFIALEKESLRLLVFTDASFANNKDLSSQIGMVLVLADSKNNANIIHWCSIKCKRVTRSVLASELYGMAHGFDMAASAKSTLDLILNISVPLVLCTDSKSLYDCLVKLGTTQEKRLMIDVMCLRQAYERREIAEVKWIAGTTNPADSMTKSKPSNALKLLIDANKVKMDVQEWVERE
jgi:hypothetical protein